MSNPILDASIAKNTPIYQSSDQQPKGKSFNPEGDSDINVVAKKTFKTLKEQTSDSDYTKIKAKKSEAIQEAKDSKYPKDYIKVGSATVFDPNGLEIKIDIMEKARQGKLRTYIACHEGKELGFITFHKVSLPNDSLIPKNLLEPFAKASFLDDNYGSAKMMYYESQAPDLSNKIYIKNFSSMRSQTQIKGIGTALMQAVYETSKNEGCKGKLILDASGDSPVFYYKLGLRAMIGDNYKKACNSNKTCNYLTRLNKRLDGGDFMMYLPHSAMKAWDNRVESKPILKEQPTTQEILKEPVNLQDQKGNTPLHRAIQKIYIRDDHYDELRQIIESSADLTIENNDGKTALGMCFEMAEKGNILPLTTLLLLLTPEQKVAFFKKHYDGSLPDPLKICFVQIFDEQPQDCLNIFHNFSEDNCSDLLHTLLKYSSQTTNKATDSEGNTLLHYACRHLTKSIDVMQFLTLENITQQNREGKTPSDMALNESIKKYMGRVMKNPEDYI